MKIINSSSSRAIPPKPLRGITKVVSLFEYTERKNYKLNIYKKNKDTVISLSAKNDVKYLKFSLQQKLKKENINIHEINEE